MAETLDELHVTPERLRHYDQRIPRYTSYPTAPYWKPEFEGRALARHLEENSDHDGPLSLYIHIPFCEKHCLFCACNTIITTKREVAGEYLDWIEREVALMASRLKRRGPVIQLHLGGGTPNYLSHEQMARLVRVLEEHFPFAPDAERSIEVDPRVATPEDIRCLYSDHRFNRISFGVQDFHAETQAAIGREQTRDISFANVAAARAAGFTSVNIDLIYGLPLQTEHSWRATIDAIEEMRPDRIALYNFAYLPGRLAHQRTLDESQLPDPSLKLDMFIETHNRLLKTGWEFIGMDHYALADDSLARALSAGTLRRNFMGYTTLRGTDMLAFGVSAITDYQGAFAQNDKKLTVHRRMIEEGILPVERGMVLSADDRFRRFVIEEIMCNGVLHLNTDPAVAGGDIYALVMDEADRLAPLADDGLVVLDDTALRVTTKGRIFLRNIAVLFDAYLKDPSGKRPMFSRTV